MNYENLKEVNVATKYGDTFCKCEKHIKDTLRGVERNKTKLKERVKSLKSEKIKELLQDIKFYHHHLMLDFLDCQWKEREAVSRREREIYDFKQKFLSAEEEDAIDLWNALTQELCERGEFLKWRRWEK